MGLLNQFLGLNLEPKNLTLLHVSLRAVLVFVSALVMVRVADRRFLSKMSAVDVILGFILASMLARATNGSAAFFPSLVGGFVLVFFHKICVALAFHFPAFGHLIKGRAAIIIENGKVCEPVMRQHHITEKDLLEELRQEGGVPSPEQVEIARVERSG